jgi:hypothetical protein|tara:strand:- start:73807 stop:74124 length:318 start_codon:yes stop_codon:yes gene_type:complete
VEVIVFEHNGRRRVLASGTSGHVMDPTPPLPNSNLPIGRRSTPWLERAVLSAYIIGAISLASYVRGTVPPDSSNSSFLIYPAFILISLFASEFTVRVLERLLKIR